MGVLALYEGFSYENPQRYVLEPLTVPDLLVIGSIQGQHLNQTSFPLLHLILSGSNWTEFILFNLGQKRWH